MAGALPQLVFFAAIGLGFMLVEISQMQRLTIFLGHPTYGLSIVLFALLVSSGAGSLSTQTVQPGPARPTMIRLGLILVALCAFGVLTPWALGMFREAPTPQRILVAVLLLFPVGLFMGMAFPLGMKVVSAREDAATPWLWGINGATSVCASVLAVAVAMSAGISVSFWSGVACYGVAAAAFARRAGERGRVPNRAGWGHAGLASFSDRWPGSPAGQRRSGLSRSRSQSPTRLKPITVSMIASPGNVESHQAV